MSRNKARRRLLRWDRYLDHYRCLNMPEKEHWARITDGWTYAWTKTVDATERNAELHAKHAVFAILGHKNPPKGWGVRP